MTDRLDALVEHMVEIGPWEMSGQLMATFDALVAVAKAAKAVEAHAPLDPQASVPAGFWRDVNALCDAVEALEVRR